MDISMNTINRLILIPCLFVSLMAILATNSMCLAESDHIYWNDQYIVWQEYEEGLASARISRKPAIIIFYADWCPTCKKYGKVFKNEHIIRAAASFVMIRVNIDTYPQVSADYGFDGEYIPRTIAVYPDGRVMHELYPAKKNQYYIGTNPNNLLLLMRKALSRV